MEAQPKKIFNFRPIFYSFLILTLAISSAKFIFDAKITYILLVCLVFVLIFSVCVFRRKLLPFFILLSVFCFGIGWYFVGLATFNGKSYVGECQIVGRISDDISYSQYDNSFSVVLKSVKIDNKKAKNIYLTVDYDDADEIQIGDIISFSAELSKVNLFELGKFKSYYYRNNVVYTSETSTDAISILKNKMTFDEKLRQKIKASLYSKMGVENGAVAYGVLFGDKTDISEEVEDAYKSAGVIHLLTVSGLHISFFIALLGFILKKCRVNRWANLIICVIFIGLYAYLCGFTPSVVRAGVMGLVLTFASIAGKRYDSLNSLGLAGILILLVRPLSALDLGFLMSFFCVLGIFTIYPILSKCLKKFLPKRVAGALALSISAQIGVFPFALEIGALTNFLSPFANLLIIPIFSVIYPVLFAGAVLTLLLPFMGFILTFCGWGFDAIYKLAEFFGQTKLTSYFEPLNIFTIAFGVLFFFSLSKFFLGGWKARAVVCSILLCLLSFSVVFEFKTNTSSSISVCYNYSNSLLLLTNNSGESVIIDVGYESFTKQLLRTQNVDKVSTAFVLQSSKVKISSARQIGVSNIVRIGSGEGYTEETLVEIDETGYVAGFTFTYRSNNNKMVGLEIAFDGIKLFIARERWTTEENFAEIGEEDFDFVVVGKKAEYAKMFKNATKIVAFNKSKGVSSSYEEKGNIEFSLRNNKIIERCLD